MNYAIIVGRLVKEPEYKNVGDKILIKLRVATTENNITEYHRISIFRKNIKFYETLKISDTLAVEGKIKNIKYEDKDGVIKYSTVIDAHKIDKI
jgi:single-stranded DNA-binding protein